MNGTQRRDMFDTLTALILVGGQGSRLKSLVSDRPKPMAHVAGRPFLDMVIDHASGCGLRRFVLCTGYMGDVISAHYAHSEGPCRVLVSRETSPLGTAGAIKNAEFLIESDPFIVMNGDSLCLVDLRELYESHLEKSAEVSMVVTRMERTGDYGTIVMSPAGGIEKFEEKTGSGTYANAGVYCMGKRTLAKIPPGTPWSLERDVFPVLAGHGLHAFATTVGFADIGTPDRYREAMARFAPVSPEDRSNDERRPCGRKRKVM